MTSETKNSQKDSEEVKSVDMTFADQHDLDPNMDEDDYIDEQVNAVEVGPNRWRLEQNPMWTEMAVYKDTVEGELNEDGVFVVRKVVEKSGLRTIRTGVPRMFYFSDFGKAFLDRVMDAGGMWDLLFWGILVLNLPEDDADELEEMFKAAVSEARHLNQTETRPPSQLYKENPEGGTTKTEERN